MEEKINNFIRITENLIEILIKEKLYQNSGKASVKLLSKRKKELLDEYTANKYLIIGKNTKKIKELYPFLFKRLQYLNQKLLILAMQDLKIENNTGDIKKC